MRASQTTILRDGEREVFSAGHAIRISEIILKWGGD
jgi:hypothetical protein